MHRGGTSIFLETRFSLTGRVHFFAMAAKISRIFYGTTSEAGSVSHGEMPNRVVKTAVV